MAINLKVSEELAAIEPEATIAEEERLIDYFQPHPSRIPDFNPEKSAEFLLHYLQQLQTCNPKARVVVLGAIAQLERHFNHLVNLAIGIRDIANVND